MASPRTMMKRLLTSAVPQSVLARALPYKSAGVERAAWDNEYADDAWEHLRSASELARYNIITGYCQFYRSSGLVLDVGCGEGVLAEQLNAVGRTQYLGVDISEAAIEKARTKGMDNFEFVVASAELFDPPGSNVEVTVFNEVLYYFTDPKAQVERYARRLAPTGMIVVSLENTVRGNQIWNMLKERFSTIDDTRIQKRGLTWDVRLLMPNQSFTKLYQRRP